MNIEQFEALLYQDESPILDFKRDQYPFQGESSEVKGEIIKDILAFANSWRRSDAYILVGVEEVKGGRSHVVGVHTHLNDNDLQQLVNSKTQRPVEFSYFAFRYHTWQVGIIHVPVQEGPLYLTKDFGCLSKNHVYIRRGSSTAIANPDEIAKMGKAAHLVSESPQLKLELAAPKGAFLLGETTILEPIIYSIPFEQEIPDQRLGPGRFTTPSGTNQHYYRQRAVFIRDFARVQPLRLAVTNFGNATAHDVKLEVHISSSDLYVHDEYNKPTCPNLNPLLPVTIANGELPLKYDVSVETVQNGWRVIAEFGKCQPKQTIITSSKLYIGASSSCEVILNSRLFSDELLDPVESSLVVRITVKREKLSMDYLLRS